MRKLGFVIAIILATTTVYAKPQPTIDARAVATIVQDGQAFKDLNKNVKLDVYEDLREPVAKRV